MITKKHIGRTILVKPTDPVEWAKNAPGHPFHVIDVCYYDGNKSAFGYFINEGGFSVDIYLNMELWVITDESLQIPSEPQGSESGHSSARQR